MTPELAYLRRLHEAATPGPWLPSVHSESVWNSRIEHEESRRFWPVWVIHHDEATTIRVEDRVGFKNAMADAKLMSALRNLAPELVALLEAVERVDFGIEHESIVDLEDALDALRSKLREAKP